MVVAIISMIVDDEMENEGWEWETQRSKGPTSTL